MQQKSTLVFEYTLTFATGLVNVVVMYTVVYTQFTVLTLIQVGFFTRTMHIIDPNGTLTTLMVGAGAITSPLDGTFSKNS